VSAIANYSVTGMTCDHCSTAVSAELREVTGVLDVVVALNPGSVSTVVVTSEEPLAVDLVRAAVAEAGYDLADA
jgi:copper chaperone